MLSSERAKFTGYAGTSELPSPNIGSAVAGCFLSRKLLTQLSLVSLQLRIPSKFFFVYPIRASQQLEPHFMILALSLNLGHEPAKFFVEELRHQTTERLSFCASQRSGSVPAIFNAAEICFSSEEDNHSPP